MEEPGEIVEQEVAPDVTLAALYKSSRPAVELVPGVSLSPVINAAWLPGEAKAMLGETWMPAPQEPEEGKEPPPPPPTFNAAAPEYNIMAQRLSKSTPLLKYNSLMLSIKTLEAELEAFEKLREKDKDERVREAKTNQLDENKAGLVEVEAALAELRTSFAEDPLSLVPWMGALFGLADAGLTTFDVSGQFFPHTNLRSLFSGDNSMSYYQGAETVLGVFKKRYEKERGPGKIQLLTRLVPNMFQDGYNAQGFIEGVVEKIRQAVYGAESTDPLDLVQLYWWDVQALDVEATLKSLQKLCEDQVEVGEDGELTITAPKKVRAIGLVDFPPRAIIKAIQAGVPVVSLSIPYALSDRNYTEALNTAREYNIKVFARDGLMGGLISEKYVGAASPSTTGAGDSDLDDVAAALDLANNYGGWDKVQELLKVVKGVSDKHGVKMQTVALRWQIDQGTFPIATLRWGEKTWSQFGFYYWRGSHPGLDWQLFQVDSFLDMEDMTKLNALGL